MSLERGSGAELGHRALDAALDGVLLVLAEREEDDLLRLADRADAHRERALRDGLHVALEEEAGVVLHRRRGEVDDRGAALEGRAGLVERDVSVAADAEHLDVDAAGLLDLGLVGLALLRRILGESVEDVGVGELDVDLLEEVLVHEVAVALVVRAGEPVVLVEVPALHLLVGDLLRLDGLGHLVVHEDGRRAGREAEHGLRVLLDGGGDHVSRELGGLMKIMPFLAVGYVLAGLANLGLPGLSGFVAEMTIFVGAFQQSATFYRVLTILGTTSIVVAAVYILRMVGKILYGVCSNEAHQKLHDAHWEERLAIIVLIACIAGIGMAPTWISHMIETGVAPIVNHVHDVANLVSKSNPFL